MQAAIVRMLMPSRIERTILVLRAIWSFRRIKKGRMVKMRSVAALKPKLALEAEGCAIGVKHTALSN